MNEPPPHPIATALRELEIAQRRLQDAVHLWGFAQGAEERAAAEVRIDEASEALAIAAKVVAESAKVAKL